MTNDQGEHGQWSPAGPRPGRGQAQGHTRPVPGGRWPCLSAPQFRVEPKTFGIPGTIYFHTPTAAGPLAILSLSVIDRAGRAGGETRRQRRIQENVVEGGGG